MIAAGLMKLSSDTTIRYLAKRGEEITGPYTMEGLESLVYLGKVTPDTPVSREGEDSFAPIRDQPDLARVLFPRLQAKVVPKAWGRPGESDRHDLKEFKFTEVKFEKVNKADRSGQIEVKHILREIRQAERDAGRDLIGDERFRISRRSLDFWFMLIVGNAVLYGGAFLMANTTSWVFAIAGSGLYSWGLIWSMYGVMGKY
jgi:hypothetical protein